MHHSTSATPVSPIAATSTNAVDRLNAEWVIRRLALWCLTIILGVAFACALYASASQAERQSLPTLAVKAAPAVTPVTGEALQRQAGN